MDMLTTFFFVGVKVTRHGPTCVTKLERSLIGELGNGTISLSVESKSRKDRKGVMK